MSKKRFSYNSNTGIASTKGFSKKLLAEYSVNIGNMCEFGCTFCYVPSMSIRHKEVRSILDDGYKVNEFSSYRYRENVLLSVARDLRKIRSDDHGTVIFCTTCDPCATNEHADVTIEALKLILNKSNLQARLLSKSVLIKRIAQELEEYRERISFGLSTGTSLVEISRAIESNCSSIRSRVRILHWLQDNHFRTYGMICPVIPSEVERVKELVDQVRPELLEHIWVEALNVRGQSLVRTHNALQEAGLERHGYDLEQVMNDNKNWVEYSKKLFLAFQEEMRSRGLLEKLRFLQYVSRLPPEDRKFFQEQEGAICL